MSKRLRRKLKNCIINPGDKPLMTIFQLSYWYRYLSTLKTVLKICAQANVLGLLWYYLIKDEW